MIYPNDVSITSKGKTAMDGSVSKNLVEFDKVGLGAKEAGYAKGGKVDKGILPVASVPVSIKDMGK